MYTKCSAEQKVRIDHRVLSFTGCQQLPTMLEFWALSPWFLTDVMTEKCFDDMTSLPMCGFIAQLVEHRTGIAEVTGSNPVEALIFFRLLRLSPSLLGVLVSQNLLY